MGELLSIISLIGQAGSTVSNMHEAELKNTADYQAKQKAKEEQEVFNTQQKAAEESYNQTIDRLNQQFEAGLAETDASGNPTDLGLAMKQIVNNFMETSTTALRQWSAERGMAGSTVEAQGVANAATKAQESAQAYKQTEANRLYTQKEDLTNKAKTTYDMNMVTPTNDLNLAIGERNAASKANTGYDPTTDIAAFLGNIGKLVKTSSVPDTVTGVSATNPTGYVQKTGTVFETNKG